MNAASRSRPGHAKGVVVIVLGLVLMLIGFLVGIPILWTLGIIVLVIGLILFVLGSMGREVGGRKYWY